jgi:hypothetical protein
MSEEGDQASRGGSSALVTMVAVAVARALPLFVLVCLIQPRCRILDVADLHVSSYMYFCTLFVPKCKASND